MTITNESNRIVYAGNGSTKIFSYPYYYSDKGHIVVVIVDEDGVETPLALTTDYTLTDPDPAGGTVTLLGDAPAATDSLVIYRDVPATQEFNPEEGGALPADVLEAALDKLTCLAQQLKDSVDRSIVLSPASPYSGLRIPDPQATRFLRWNDDGDALVNGGTADQIENAQAYAEIAQNAANNLTCNRYEETVAGSAKSAFTLPFEIVPSNANIAVIINGIWQPPSAYTIVDETHVTLSEAVPVGTNVNFISMNIPGLSTISGKMDMPTSKVAGNLVQMDANGNGVNAGYATPAMFRKNFLINGNFAVSQRGTTFTANGMTLDRWRLSHNATSVAIQHATAEMAPSNGNTILRMNLYGKGGSFSDLAVMNVLESRDSRQMAGQTVTLSVYLRRNPTFNAGTFTLNIYAGTGTDEQSVTTGRVTSSLVIPYSDILDDNTFKRFSLTAAIDASCRQVGVVMRMSSASIPDNSYIDLCNAQLEIGGVATDFEFRPFAEELALCQRYYEKSFELAQAPAQNTLSGAGACTIPQMVGASAAQYAANVYYKVRKRITVTPVLYNPSAANAQARNGIVGADCSNTTPISLGEQGFALSLTTAAGSAAGQVNNVHWSADAEL